MALPLTYRMFRDEDLPSLLGLWEQDTGWGTLAPDTWRAWYRDTPHGDGLIVVAVDEKGMIAGQEVFLPARVMVDGCEVRALRLSAPILRRDVRQMAASLADHPTVQLYRTAAEAARGQDYRLVYAFTQHSWLPLFRQLPRFTDAVYECVGSPISGAAAALSQSEGKSFVAEPEIAFGSEYDALWQASVKRFPLVCGVVRSPAWLRYRLGSHTTLAVRERDASNALVGYSATRKDGLLVDILARDPADLAPVLAATLRWMASPESRAEFDTLKAMRTPILSPALDTLGFAPVGYRFAFVCDPIDPNLSPSTVAPARWYLSPGD